MRLRWLIIAAAVLAIAGAAYFFVPTEERRIRSRLTDLADALGTYLVGQIHSHPGLFLDLSEVDEKYGVRCQDYLSLVCPHYAQRPVAGIEECGVHMFDRGSFRRLGAAEVARRVSILPAKVEVVDLEVPA